MKAISVDLEKVKGYLEEVLGGTVSDLKASLLGEGADSIKGYGYGRPLLLGFRLGEETRRLVLETMPAGQFGHEHFADRAQIMLWKYPASSSLPKHARSLDVGAFLDDGRLLSVGRAEEFFLLTEFKEGEGYFHDLERLATAEKPEPLDEERARALALYLAQIHSVKKNEAGLYVRRIRELIGHGECLMGLTDSYPPDFQVPGDLTLEEIEKKAVTWRWRLKGRAHRLCQVHGDFHPWNLLFRQGADFITIDRSRGEWGEAADDVTAMTINYLFFSLQHQGRLAGAYERLFRLFWETYLEKTGDTEITEVVQPFYAWRGLVVASPVWYPRLAPEVRAALFRFIGNLLETERFDLSRVNEYLR